METIQINTTHQNRFHASEFVWYCRIDSKLMVIYDMEYMDVLVNRKL